MMGSCGIAILSGPETVVEHRPALNTTDLLRRPAMSETQDTAPVVYRPIEGFPHYRVGDDGSVWTERKQHRYGGTSPWRKMKPQPRKGYLRVGLRKELGGRLHWRSVHILVLTAFRGPCPDGMEACHAPNPDPTDNRLCNLRWDTHLANRRDQDIAGTAALGERARHTLKEADVQDVRRMLSCGMTLREVSTLKGVNWSTIRAIHDGKTWKHLPPPTGDEVLYCRICGRPLHEHGELVKLPGSAHGYMGRTCPNSSGHFTPPLRRRSKPMDVLDQCAKALPVLHSMLRAAGLNDGAKVAEDLILNLPEALEHIRVRVRNRQFINEEGPKRR